MAKDSQITHESFERMLTWLSPDREEAGRQYEHIRQGLIRFFRFRGCSDPDALSDETINRVTKKLLSFTFDKNVKKITYFYSFASRIYLEDLANRKKGWVALDNENELICAESVPDRDDEDRKFRCLDECLSKRPLAERTLVIRYYSSEKSEKLELRRALASEMKISPAALHTRLHRIRVSLRQCLDDCLCHEVS